jgi:hypothetical protein
MKHHFFLAQSATDLTRKETYCNISEFYKWEGINTISFSLKREFQVSKCVFLRNLNLSLQLIKDYFTVTLQILLSYITEQDKYFTSYSNVKNINNSPSI